MSRSWLLYLDDLIASAEKIGRLVGNRSFESFVADEAVFDAVLFNLQVIGEASKKLPAGALERLPSMGSSGPARLRDLIAHHYFSVDSEIIWEVATARVPQLVGEAVALRDQTEESGRTE